MKELKLGYTVTYYPHDGSEPVEGTVSNVLSSNFVDIEVGGRVIERVQVAGLDEAGRPDTHFCTDGFAMKKKGKSTETP